MNKKGGCDCGAVRFQARLEDAEATACLCSQCRRWSGFIWASVVVEEAFVQIQDAGALKWRQSSASARRGFCSECGSSLFWKELETEKIDIALGAFDDPSSLSIVADIFTKDAPSQFRRQSARPQHVGDRTTPLLKTNFGDD